MCVCMSVLLDDIKKDLKYMRFKILAAVNIKIVAFLSLTSCSFNIYIPEYTA
jgi:hypothetical protein